MSTEYSWTGACVSDEMCRWVQGRDELSHLRCRYTEGQVFENGPPADLCPEGALAQDPFCGGACGDTCPPDPFGHDVSCVGRSETRGVGVCVTNGYQRCGAPELDNETAYEQCRAALQSGGAASEDLQCVCMILSPVLMEEYADRGWAVSERTCLAYQARYPGEVRCVPDAGAP